MNRMTLHLAISVALLVAILGGIVWLANARSDSGSAVAVGEFFPLAFRLPERDRASARFTHVVLYSYECRWCLLQVVEFKKNAGADGAPLMDVLVLEPSVPVPGVWDGVSLDIRVASIDRNSATALLGPVRTPYHFLLDQRLVVVRGHLGLLSGDELLAFWSGPP